jgi:cytoskeletal protein RodZ
METLGQFLKEQRIKSNKSLDEIAQTTRIRKGLLDALEQDKYDLLPPRSYVRGMVKQYAQEVGIDVNEVLDRFETAPIEKSKKEGSAKIKIGTPSSFSGGYLLLLIVIGIGFVVYFIYTRTDVEETAPLLIPAPQETVNKQSSPTTAIVTSAPVTSAPVNSPPPGFIASVVTEAITPTSTTSLETPALTTRPFTMRFEAQANTWMRIQADGKKSAKIILKSGESYQLTADNTIIVRLGNAGGVSIFFNDVPLAKAGKSGEVVSLEFPAAAQNLLKAQ